MLDKILSQDNKTGFAVQLYLVFKKHNWGIIGKNLEHCFKSIIRGIIGSSLLWYLRPKYIMISY